MEKLKIFIVLNFLISGFSSYGQYNKSASKKMECQAPPLQSSSLASFYRPLKSNELEDSFLRSVAMGKKEAVDCFIEKGILNEYPYYKTSALAAAIVFYPKFANRFIDLGAQLHTTVATSAITKDFLSSRGTALHLAIGYNRRGVFDKLMRKGVDVSEANGHKYDPLQSAIFYDRYKMADILLKRGANPNQINRGRNSFDVARKKDDEKFIKLLKSYQEEKKRIFNFGF